MKLSQKYYLPILFLLLPLKYLKEEELFLYENGSMSKIFASGRVKSVTEVCKALRIMEKRSDIVEKRDI